MLEILLGPLEVRDGDRILDVRRRKQRALLAALALRAGDAVSPDRLIDELWGRRTQDSEARARELRLRAAQVTRSGDHRHRSEAATPSRSTATRSTSRASSGSSRRHAATVQPSRRRSSATHSGCSEAPARRPRVRAVRRRRHRTPPGTRAGGARGSRRGRARARSPRGRHR